MKANRKFIENKAGVSAVIGVILMVSITIAISAVTYYYVKQLEHETFCEKNILRGYTIIDSNKIIVVFHDIKSGVNNSYYIKEYMFDNNVNISVLNNLTGKYIGIFGYCGMGRYHKTLFNPYNVDLITQIKNIDECKWFYYCN